MIGPTSRCGTRLGSTEGRCGHRLVPGVSGRIGEESNWDGVPFPPSLDVKSLDRCTTGAKCVPIHVGRGT